MDNVRWYIEMYFGPKYVIGQRSFSKITTGSRCVYNVGCVDSAQPSME